MPECCSTVPNSAINPCILNEWNSNYEYLYFVSFCKYTKMNGTFLSFCFWSDMTKSYTTTTEIFSCARHVIFMKFFVGFLINVRKYKKSGWSSDIWVWWGVFMKFEYYHLLLRNYKSLFYLNIVNFTTIWNILYFL